MPYVSFIPAPCCLSQAAAADLVTPLQTWPVDRVAPFLSLSIARPPSPKVGPKLPQPQVDLIHIAPPIAILCCCVCCSKLERAALEV